jgi:hypothetical protein
MAIFSPTKKFVKVDLPTLGRPAMVIIAVFVFIAFYLLSRLTEIDEFISFVGKHSGLVDIVALVRKCTNVK